MSVLKFDCRFSYPAGFKLDLRFQIDSGITALVGPSGVGKTTTLHLIAGILRPQSGCIRLGERLLFDTETQVDLPIHRRNVGMVFQDHQLFPHLSVAANLRYGLQRSAARTKDISHLIEVLELGPLLKRYPASLSGGQKQRVAIGRAIARSPAILLLDEPVNALDHELKSSIVDYLAQTLREFPIPTLLVTHDVAIVDRVGASVIKLGN